MKRRIIKIMPAALFALSLLASCDGDEFGAERQAGIGGGEKIRFEITAGAAATGKATRVATGGDLSCAFQAGDAIGLFIVRGNAGLQASGNYVQNRQMTFNGAGWSHSNVYYPPGNEPIHVYAYYPYRATADPTDLTLTVQADQGTLTNLGRSHLMKASRLNVSRSSNPVVLSFEHLAALVELKVTEGQNAGEQMPDGVAVTIEGCRAQLGVNLSTGVATPSGNATSIKMYRREQPGDADYLTSHTYRALVPAQTAAANADLFKLTQGVRSLSHKPSGGVVLEAGKTKPYDITLQNTTASHIYVVGDYYPYTGFEPVQGVVFEVSDGGQHGKMMGLDMVRRAWGPEAILTNANNSANGRINMNQINSSYNIADYAAFNWVHEKNASGTTYDANATGIWYLPAIDELKRLYEAYNGGSGESEATPGARAAFNSKLTAAGGQTLPSVSDHILSSTESSGSTASYTARVLNPVNGTDSDNQKTYDSNQCRAIMAF